jgi:hypothetical protein
MRDLKAPSKLERSVEYSTRTGTTFRSHYSGSEGAMLMRHLVLLASIATVLDAQTERMKTGDALAKLQLAVTRAALGRGLTQSDGNLLREIGQSADTLDDRFKNARSAESADEFAQSVLDDALALDQMPGDPRQRSAVLKDLRDDLALKARFASGSLGVSTAFPAVVKVTIEIQKDGKIVDGLWVRCNPRRYGVTDTPMFPFPSASSPTTRRMPPGIFTVWVESPDHKLLASQTIEIGTAEEDSERIRFTVP